MVLDFIMLLALGIGIVALWYSITTLRFVKSSKVLPPKPLSACAENQDMDAGLCYDKCKNGYKGVGPVCWGELTDIGVGVPLQ